MTRAAAHASTDPAAVAAAHRLCLRIAAEHGRTYFLATRLLSADRREAVHALYAFARIVDDIVDYDDSDPARTAGQAAARHIGQARDAARQLDDIERRLDLALGQAASPPDPGHPPVLTDESAHVRDQVLTALADTVRRYDLDTGHFATFLAAMRMDIPGTPQFRDRYASMAELREYMRGSAAAIGLQLLPVLGTVTSVREAEPAAAALGEAFQLTNFLRDIGEDLDRGRVYLPLDELAAFGVDVELLTRCRRDRRTDPRLRRALAHLIAVNRDLYRRADRGMALLAPEVRPAIRTARVLYAEILTGIESSGYAVFDGRTTVPKRRRLRIAATEYASARLRR